MIDIGGNIGELYVGSTEITKAYVGNQLVWEKGSPVFPYDAVIEYLQGSGTHYILPQYTTNANSIISLDAQLSVVTAQFRLIGNTSGYFECYVNGNKRWSFTSNGSTAASSVSSNTNRHTFLLDNVKTKGYIDATAVTIKKNSSSYFNSVGLFARPGGSTCCSGKIYGANIYDGTTPVHDFIPVRRGQTGYLYDRISGNLFENAGTGSFTLGNDIPSVYDSEIEYIEGTGTQWINTGIHSFIGDSISITLSTTSFGASFLCGARASSSNMTGSFFIYGDVSNNVAFAANGTYTSSNTDIQDGNIHIIEHKQDGGYIDGVKKASISMSDAPSTRTYALFTTNDRDAPTNISSCKLYGFTYKRGSITIMDLIPVRVGQVGYMYDKVSGALFGNAGSGNFTLGSDI